jgi:plastocyanin
MKKIKTPIRFVFLHIVIAVLFISSCKKAPNPPANEVYMQNKKFYPNQLVVKQGTTVTWTDKDAVKYTVTETNHLFDSGKLDKDQTFSYYFNVKGTYYYTCNTYANMNGTIVVE